MTIGDAARALGVESHVLRHWDDVGALRPSERTAAGHRRYTAADLDRGRIALRCQRTGMTLADIAGLGDRDSRRRIVERNLEQLRQQRAQIDRAATFLEHTLSCTHSIAIECADCAEFARG